MRQTTLMSAVILGIFGLALSIPAVQVAQGSEKSAKAKRYEALAKKYRPTSRTDQQLVQEYMRLPASRRGSFKTTHPNVSKSIWDYAPYAVCFYASVAGGADTVEAGDECHEKWVD